MLKKAPPGLHCLDYSLDSYKTTVFNATWYFYSIVLFCCPIYPCFPVQISGRLHVWTITDYWTQLQWCYLKAISWHDVHGIFQFKSLNTFFDQRWVSFQKHIKGLLFGKCFYLSESWQIGYQASWMCIIKAIAYHSHATVPMCSVFCV